MIDSKRIALVGTGYVGLVAGACFADWGHQVVCIDHDEDRIATLLAGGIPIYEPELDKVVARAVKAGRLTFATDLPSAVSGCDVAFIAVGTPPRKTDGEADLSFVYESAGQLARSLKRGAVIVTKSTVPVGTGDVIERIVKKIRPDASITVASNPEFLREGSAISDFCEPDRVVIGSDSDDARSLLQAIYQPVADRGHTILVTRRRSAELIKYAANAFLATKITFINEIADICEAVDADVGDIALGMGLDKRIGPHFLHAGPGYGGSCFPKDTLALVRTAQEYGVALRIVEQTVQANSARKRRMAQKVRHLLHGSVENKRIAILGLTFKADTDDMRDSPSIPMIELLQRSGATIHAFDPEGMEQAGKLLSDVTYHSDPYECAAQADAVVFMTDWDVLKHLDLARLASVMHSPVMVDLRRIYPPEEAARQGFVVETIGSTGLEPQPMSEYQPHFLLPDIAAKTRLPVAFVPQEHNIQGVDEPDRRQIAVRKEQERRVATQINHTNVNL